MKLKVDVNTYMEILSKVMRHFKTLLKYLNDQVHTAKDPTVIEHTNRQIKAINSLKTSVKMSIKSSNKLTYFRNSSSKESMETFFSGLSASDSNCEGRSSMASGKQPIMERPTLHEIQINNIDAQIGRPSLKRKKIEIIQDDGYTSTMTNINQKTMAQTDAEREGDDDKEEKQFKSLKMLTRSKSPVADKKENLPAMDHLTVPQLRRRSAKAQEKTAIVT